MGQITINRDHAMGVLNDANADPTARVIAACTVAFFEANDHADEIDSSTRSIALKLSHMVASAIYDAAPAVRDEG